MGLEKLTLKLIGTRPLLMHNGRLANPTDEATKALKHLTAKKKKTEADHLEIKKMEWLGSLYQDESARPCVTEDMILGCVVAGAKKLRMGNEAKSGVLGDAPYFPLEYKGPKDVMALYDTGKFCDYRNVGVMGKRVMRARPVFNQWSATVTLTVETSSISVEQVLEAVKTAGLVAGLGDFRPRFGRFDVERVH